MFVFSATALLAALLPVLAEQRQRLLEQDRRQGVALYAVERTPAGPPRPRLRGWLGEP